MIRGGESSPSYKMNWIWKLRYNYIYSEQIHMWDYVQIQISTYLPWLYQFRKYTNFLHENLMKITWKISLSESLEKLRFTIEKKSLIVHARKNFRMVKNIKIPKMCIIYIICNI